ncbi:MAG TPA: sulfite exporter TauE/SafE family protein [Oligoflexus sp.]|uniref:sulfite exporter TauE/SafE family protein n=1 Tax=Oligoflexus sp. TaxID=1971216 RepID=UPI002D4FD450|nr:sulfite exporter TauE/SafE family protein [Oligoflexus sp.]HYX32322.1 sulfite exporter TauE/SafE family protein [Oligoflexus sp.]
MFEICSKIFVSFLVGCVASFICASTGGAGLISTPALIFLGLTPQSAIATDLLAMLGGAIGSFQRFYRSGTIDFRLGGKLMALTGIGALLGGRALLSINAESMQKITAILLLVILAIVLLRGKPQPRQEPASALLKGISFLLFVGVGFWGTFFGAGFLIFASTILVLLFGKSLLESAGLLSLLSLTVGLVAVLVYGRAGSVQWSYCIAMGLARHWAVHSVPASL